MVVATLDLYERILARLPPSALRDSCNGVLQREVDDVQSRLTEVVEAFGRLKEVETAVTQLQQDKGNWRRSASLMALVDDTEAVQRQLNKELKRMGRSFLVSDAVETFVEPVDSKVKPKADAGNEPESDDNGSKHRKSKKKTRKTSGRETGAVSSTPDGPVGVLELAQSFLRLVSDDSLSLDELQTTGIDSAKLIFQRLAQGEEQAEAAAQVVEAALDAFANRLSKEKKLVKPGRIKKLVAAISAACTARPSLRSHVFRAQAQLESVLLEANSGSRVSEKLHSILQLAQEVGDLPDQEKIKRIGGVMASIQASISGQATQKARLENVQVLTSAVKLVANLVIALPTEQLALSTDLGDYRAFCDAMLDVADKNSTSTAGKGLARHVGRLKLAVMDAEIFKQRSSNQNSESRSKMTESTSDASPGSKSDVLEPALELARTLRKFRSVKERHERLPELMDAVVDALPRVPDAAVPRSTSAVLHIVRQMMEWVGERPIDAQMLARYDRFCKSATQFSYHITHGSTRTGLYRKVDELLRAAISKSAEASTKPEPASEEDAVPSKASNKRGHDDAVASVAASNTVSEALEQVNTWQDGIFSLQQLDKVIKTIDRVLDEHRHNSAWNPLMDESVIECMAKLRACVEGIKKDDHRVKRLAILDAWGGGRSGKQLKGTRSGGAKVRGARSGKSKKK